MKIVCKSMADWINHLADAHEQGKKVVVADNPDFRLLGFKVKKFLSLGTTYSIPLVKAAGRDWKSPEGLKALKRIGCTDRTFGDSIKSSESRKLLITKLEITIPNFKGGNFK